MLDQVPSFRSLSCKKGEAPHDHRAANRFSIPPPAERVFLLEPKVETAEDPEAGRRVRFGLR